MCAPGGWGICEETQFHFFLSSLLASYFFFSPNSGAAACRTVWSGGGESGHPVSALPFGGDEQSRVTGGPCPLLILVH